VTAPRRRWWLIAVLAVALAGGALWAVLARRGADRTPNPPQPSLEEADPEVAEAVEIARRAVLANRRSGEAWGRLGMVLRAHDFGEEANVCFEQAERLSPDEPAWPYLRGLTLAQTDLEAGARCLERAAELGLPEARPRLAEVLLELGRLDEAERHLAEAEGDHPRVRLSLARLALARRDWQGGLAQLEGLVEDVHCRKLARGLMAEALQRLKRPKRAAAEQERARELPEDRPWPTPVADRVEALRVGRRAVLARADRWSWQGRVPEAVGLLEALVRERPDDGGAWLLLGRVLLRAGRHGQAGRALEEAVRAAPGSTEAWFQFGVVRVFLRDPRGAAEAFGTVVRLKPDHALGHFNLGLCRKELGDRAGAARSFRRALLCRPDFEPARKALAALPPGP
jgi:tetratricopeptide (TPR) repeat protein